MKSRIIMNFAAGTLAAIISQSHAEEHEHCACSAHSCSGENPPLSSDIGLTQISSLPADLPETFSLQLSYEGRQLTLNMHKNEVFGPNTRFLVAGENGELTEIDPGETRTYLGTVVEEPKFAVSAVLGEDGLNAMIIRPNQETIVVEPAGQEGDTSLYRIKEGHGEDHQAPNHICTADSHDSCGHEGCDHSSHSSDGVAASVGKVTVGEVNLKKVSAKAAASSTATLPPSRVMEVYEYEIGVEIGSPAFLNNYGGNLSQAQTVAQGIPGNLDARYLRACGIKHRLGTVIIRTSAAEDKFSVANGNDRAGLSAFRNYWNANPGEVGTTHDLAVFHVRGGPSGLAYVNTVGGGSRYALSASNGPTSWADGTLAHEFGHSWSLGHYNASLGRFFSVRPRNGNGATSAGGNNYFISVMHGGGNHNIGRLSTGEANQVYNVRQGKRQFGDLIADPGPIAPFGHTDEVIAVGDPITIDVIANDYDSNNDVLDVHLLDTVSFLGGTITLSEGTGPGGRNEVTYTPPASGNGEDFFHYTVCDSTGRTDWGAVYIDNNGPSIVDQNLTKYVYDVGPPNSVLFTHDVDNYQKLSEITFGEIGFTSDGPNPVESRDRGADGANDINRDHIRMRSPGEFRHVLAAGIYDVLFTVGDKTEGANPIRFNAENSVEVTTQSHEAAAFVNYILEDVTVIDGELNVRIENLGFASNFSRIIITRVGDADVDSDDDGLQDAWEEEFFGNLTTSSGLPDEDADDDGLTDREEHDGGTNPTSDDSDGDKLLDGEEGPRYGTNPALSDTDGDGFDDGTEVAFGSDPTLGSSTPDVPNLVAYYTFDEGSGTRAMNLGSAGSAADAEQNQGAIGWSTSGHQVGSGSLALDGSSSLLAASPVPDEATELTISVWVNPGTDGGYKGIYAGRSGPGNWGINVENGHADVRFANSGGSSQGVDTADDSVVASGGWYHVALTWVSTGTESLGKVYLNGVLVGETTGARPDFSQPTEGFYLGDDPCCNNREFNGLIDDLAVFTRVLSAEEIAMAYDSGQAGQNIISSIAPAIAPPATPKPVSFAINAANADVNFSFQTEAGVTYRIYSSTDLQTWGQVGTTVLGDGEVYDFSHENGSDGVPVQFYIIE